MSWIKIENNIVVQKQPNQEDGFIEAEDTVICGQIQQDDGTFINPTPTELPYDIKRRNEYPPIGDQLDDLFHAGAFSTEMTATIQAVKDKYPKE